MDETDSSPQDFESFSLRPLRYVSIFLLTFSMPLCNPFMPLCNPFTPAHAAKSYTQLTQAFNYDSLSHFNYFCNPFMHLYLSFFRFSHHPRISRALLLSFALCTLRIENTKSSRFNPRAFCISSHHERSFIRPIQFGRRLACVLPAASVRILTYPENESEYTAKHLARLDYYHFHMLTSNYV